MQSNELRIGNWIQCNIVRLGNLKKGDYHQLTISDFNHNLEDYYKPIPLTEEWLVKFGFKYGSCVDGSFLIKNGVHIAYFNDRFCFNPHVSNASSCDLKYVHQLQNLYFALTGEELTIKE